MTDADGPLALVSFDELADELLRRCDHGVICVMRERNDGMQTVQRKWVGNSHTCAGLAWGLAQTVLEAWHRLAVTDDEDLGDDLEDRAPGPADGRS